MQNYKICCKNESALPKTNCQLINTKWHEIWPAKRVTIMLIIFAIVEPKLTSIVKRHEVEKKFPLASTGTIHKRVDACRCLDRPRCGPMKDRRRVIFQPMTGMWSMRLFALVWQFIRRPATGVWAVATNG